ncbi:CinA family protein [Epilithonimonas zeae]|uniref:Amidohydrolase, PncC family n=1 Tax=Epilithonimonas zeae TaxID=1416779 RepID=A0A1N6FUI7_9FLAO|nr:CinA family protein [Epilithonimonas zeae]SIN98831.1 amidohydrolase, PncC family [Epilithonimonas zeae]
MIFHKPTLDLISQSLLLKGKTISVAEDVTSGLLQFSFSQMQNAPLFYKGGMTVCTVDEKIRLLNVEPAETRNCGISEYIADKMAVEIAKVFHTDWGIGITGYVSPIRESGFSIYMHFSMSYKGSVVSSRKMELDQAMPLGEAQLFFTRNVLEQFKCKLESYKIS